jgi:serine/threonine-protein kinase
MIDFRVLGGVQLSAKRPGGARDAVIQPKRMALLLYLALAEPTGMHARDRLLTLLWPEADEESARHSLRNGLHALRRALGDVVVTRGEVFVGLDFGMVRCDALELREHLRAGRVDEAVGLLGGELAAGFNLSGAPEFERWLDAQRAELHRSVVAAAWKRAGGLEGAGSAELDALRQAAGLDPGNEPGARRLMRLLADAGDRGSALAVYQDLTTHLARELETGPSAETRAFAATLRERVASLPTPLHRAPVTAPEVGSPSVEGTAIAARPARRFTRGALATGTVAILSLLALRSGSEITRSARPMAMQADAERTALRIPARYRADTAAYASYLRGLQLRFEFRFMASRDTMAALGLREPLYVPGLVGLAQAYVFTALNDSTDLDESWLKVDELAHRALALDSTAADAWLALAAVDMFARMDLRHARERIARARQLDPLNAEAAGMQATWFAFYGQMDSAVAEYRLAHRLDPLSRLLERRLAKILFYARRYDESRSEFARMVRDDPRWTRGYGDLVDLYRAMGRPREAVAWLRRARAAEGDTAGAALLHDAASDSEAVQLLHADARRTITLYEAARRAGNLRPAWHYAYAYAMLGDTAATLDWLDSMVTRHDTYMLNIRVHPAFDFVRTQPRYRVWEVRTGLPPMSRP